MRGKWISIFVLCASRGKNRGQGEVDAQGLLSRAARYA